ncbi:glyoxalase superfamily protein [Rhizobium sp. BK176]|uniref:glyoxalase superfamily protein n=1 Tax=Rhizobium sp. BK176 TaxID=2587071 RepID=UPI0021681AC5|nr:glyoxalase superfamily protein [Rhizobium sp. BK176]MCS4089102.1 hypothetical protein [Rhizobium sp. BK176]
MTSNNSNAAVDGSPKRRARAVQAKLKELGASVSLGQAYEVMAVANGFRNWATMSAAAEPAPQAVASRIAVKPPESPHLRGLIGYVPDVDGVPRAVQATLDDYLNHFAVLGKNGDRLAAMLGLSESVLWAGGGLVFVDHLDDGASGPMIQKLAEKTGRSDDVIVIDANGNQGRMYGVSYSPYTSSYDGLHGVHVVQSAMRYLRSQQPDGRDKDRMLEAVRLVVEAARFLGRRDHRPLDTDLIVEVAEPARFHELATEEWSHDGSNGYWMPMSLKNDMQTWISSFVGRGVIPADMEHFHDELVKDLNAILPPIKAEEDNPWNVQRIIRERKIGIVRIRPGNVGYHRLRRMVVSEIELEMNAMPIPATPKGAMSVAILDGFKPSMLERVYGLLQHARMRGVAIMTDAPPDLPDGRSIHVVRIKDSERLLVEMGWANGPATPDAHPSEFEVLDPRVRLLEWTPRPEEPSPKKIVFRPRSL